MATKYKDYYETLGVSRTATQEEIQKAFRKLARKYHPDTSREPEAEKRFKEINEANEVLGDPEKRRRYDMLGANWKGGQEFTPPPGFEGVHFEFNEEGGGFSGFSDFFEMLFGGGRRAGGGGHPFAGFGFGGGGSQTRPRRAPRGQDFETEITVSLVEAHHGARRGFDVHHPGAGNGPSKRHYDVRIPPGTRDGARLRLSGQGGEGGDLFVTVRVAPDPRFRVEGDNLVTDVPVAPWEAVLGGKITVPTLDRPVTLTLPAGTPSGRSLRVRAHGLHRAGGGRGDLIATVKIAVPSEVTPEERELWERLAARSRFRARG